MATSTTGSHEPGDQRSTFIVRDPVHDYFVLPEELNAVTRQWSVQRLRRVAQTSTATSQFPSLTGTRFEHSLGTMHLARIAWREVWGRLDDETREVLRDAVYTDLIDTFNVRGEDHPDLPLDEHTRLWIANRYKFDKRFEKEIDLALATAGLLHDLGHPPFSHALEPFYERNSADLIGDADEYRDLRNDSALDDPLLQFHEVAGIHLARSLPPDAFRNISHNIVMRILVGGQPRDWVSALREIISGEVDVDRLDYLMRDANRAGTEFGAIDASRLFQAIELHTDTPPKKTGALTGWQLGFGYRARSAIETFLTNRIRYYQWVLFHFRVVASNKFLEEALEELLSLEKVQASGDYVAIAVAKHFAELRPALSYFASPTQDSELMVDDPSSSTQTILTFRDDDTRKIAAEVDDATITSWLRSAGKFARALNRSSHPLSSAPAVQRFSALHDAVLFREENWLSLWEDESEYAEIATSLSASLIELVDEASSQLERQSKHLLAPERILELTRVTTDLIELRQIRDALDRDASRGVNMLADRLLWSTHAGTAESRRRAEEDIRRVLSAQSTSFDSSHPNWIVSYQSTRAVRTGDNAVRIFKAGLTSPITESSRMAAELNSIAASYPRLFVFVVFPTGSRDVSDSVLTSEARRAFTGAWVHWIRDYLADITQGKVPHAG